jgi:Transmembrane secretion effector
MGFAQLSIDLRPLRGSRDFRLLFWSRLITLLGSQATEVALLLQLKDLTNSPIAVGLLGLAELGALVVFGLWGGVLADRIDRRRLMGITEIALVGAVVVLLLNALLTRPLVWPLYVLAAMIMALASVQRPSIDATVPRTVPREQLTAAAGLLGASTNSARPSAECSQRRSARGLSMPQTRSASLPPRCACCRSPHRRRALTTPHPQTAQGGHRSVKACATLPGGRN